MPSSHLDETLLALADPTRRAILRRLCAGEARVTELAQPFEMSLNAVSKHILSFNPKQLQEAIDWIETQRTAWNDRLSALDAMLKAEDRGASQKRTKKNGELK